MTLYGLFVKKDPHSELVKKLCKVLIEERERQNLSQQKLSEMAGISRTGLRHIESLETNPTLYSILKIAKVLEYDVGEYLTANFG